MFNENALQQRTKHLISVNGVFFKFNCYLQLVFKIAYFNVAREALRFVENNKIKP